MPAPPKSSSTLFLGLELATDQFRATIVDENLDLVGVERVDFDAELPEFQTQGGIFTTPGDAYTTPVEMWIKAFDQLFEKISRNHDTSRIKAIGGAAQHALVWWQSTPATSFPTYDPRLPLQSQLVASSFTLLNIPISSDTSSHTHALALESLLGGPDHMAARVGISAQPAMIAAQLLRLRDSDPNAETWARTGRVQLASSFIASLVAGKWVPLGEAEACASGIWNHQSAEWDDGVLEIIGGSRDEGRRVKAWLGEVETAAGGKRMGTISKYLTERYGFDSETIVTQFTADYLSTYLSLCPSPSDAVLSFGPVDVMLSPAQHYMPTRLYTLFPHPTQEAGEKKRYIVMLSSRNADVPRALVRDMYTKSWSAFDRLVAIVPPGGSIGLDDKLFSFWLLQGDAFPFSHVNGIFRFETGVKVNEFRDLRANPRCLLESQLLSFRVRWSRMIGTGLLGPSPLRGTRRATTPTPGQASGRPQLKSAIAQSLGLSFDPYDSTPLPTRIIATGAAANFPAISNLVGDIFDAPVLIPATQVDSAQTAPHRNAPAPGFPARAALGGAYVARWVWGREARQSQGAGGAGKTGGFEEEIRRLLGKRWVSSGGTPPRTNVNSSGLASGHNSGTSTPLRHGAGARSTLGATVVVEEDEDEVEEMERSAGGYSGSGMGVGLIGAGLRSNFADLDLGPTPRARTVTSSTDASTTPSIGQASSTLTTPDLNNPGAPIPAGGSAPLVPVQALPSTGDSELQLGLVKVAEPDSDAFMTYAAIVPEFCRLEAMLVKSIA